MPIKAIAAINLGYGYEIDPILNKINIAPTRITQVEMEDTSLDYASTVEKTTPWGDNLIISQGVVIPAAGNTFKIASPKIILLSGGITLAKESGNTRRNNIAFWWELNRGGSWKPIGMRHQNNYLRDITGHLEVSQTFPSFAFQFLASDILRMRHVQVSGYGGVQRVEPKQRSYVQFIHHPSPP